MSHYQTDDLRIEKIRPLIPAAILIEELPLNDEGSRVVAESRLAVRDIIDGRDDRLLVVVGPCSIHDTKAALEYGQKPTSCADRCGTRCDAPTATPGRPPT